MARTKIEPSDHIEYISILNEKGEVDRELEPEIPRELLLRLYRSMIRGRKFDERMLNLQRQGRIGTFPPVTGQEAAQLGAVAPLRATDWMVPSFRETTAEFFRGRSMESFLMVYNGFNEGVKIPEDGFDLPVSIPVGSQVLHAVGLGWAIRYRKRDDVVMTFFGDGATSEGDFHEAMNFAGVFQTPVIFVCQNNQWAISIPRSRQTKSVTLAEKALAYGVPGIQVDGNDLLAVYVAAEEAVKRARAGGGPTMIECVTYRLGVHTTADDPKRYRTDDEVEKWKVKDPLTRFQSYLLDKGLLNDESMGKIEAESLEAIQEAVDRAEKEMKEPADPLHMFEHAYEKMTPTLEAQRRECARELSGEPG